MIYNYYKPIPALAEIVEHYWYFKIEMTGTTIHHYPTPLLQSLTFNFYTQQEHYDYNIKITKLTKLVYFFGQQTCSRIMATKEKRVRVLGVKFKPLGIAKLTGINMENMANNIISADDIWSRELESLCDKMRSAQNIERAINVLEKFLFKKYFYRKLHYRVNTVAQALSLIESSNGTINIRDLQYKTNTSCRTLQRAFMKYLGVTPKLYSEITRFNAAKAFIDNNTLDQNLSRLAYDFGYTDGSHLSAEFKRFANVTPTEYLQRRKLKNITDF